MFLRESGAPLDNNRSEQALKMAILHRKNSLHQLQAAQWRPDRRPVHEPHPQLSAQSREPLRLSARHRDSRHRREGTPLGLAALELPAAVEKPGRTRPRSTRSPRVASSPADATCCRVIV
ncbi:MAG: hypothetical protein EXS41_02850, partial [Opitutaceae bacterium]|nr:hypothetical protein [Opitutaceae bacterium]